MANAYNINGETMVMAKGGAHFATVPGLGGIVMSQPTQVGLASDSIRITPTFRHTNVPSADFGPAVPPEVMFNLAHVDISMGLIFWDNQVVDLCMAEAMGGLGAGFGAGKMQPAGQMLGRGRPLLASGNSFISMVLLSPVLGIPWRFPASYLTAPPLEIPLGTKASLIQLNWRAIPYASPLLSGGNFTSGNPRGKDVLSSGVVLWDHFTDD